MDNVKVREEHYFLGANSPSGFSSLYDSFVDLEGGDFLYVIKGGPGCGKSTFMKIIGKAAKAHGLSVEYIHCSGDPESLDGIYIPEKKTAYVDGTAPHVIEAAYPGAGSCYLNLGAFYRMEQLKPELSDIVAINKRYKAMYGRAYSLLAAYERANREAENVSGVKAAAERAAETVMRAELGSAEREVSGRMTKKRRFLSAFTCKGKIFYEGTVKQLCERIYTVDGASGFGHDFLSAIETMSGEMGLDAVICPCPMFPDRLEALLLPGAGFGIVSVRDGGKLSLAPYRHISFITGTEGWGSKVCAQLLREAEAVLSEAKELHDELEALYNPHVDFEALRAFAASHAEALLS